MFFFLLSSDGKGFIVRSFRACNHLARLSVLEICWKRFRLCTSICAPRMHLLANLCAGFFATKSTVVVDTTSSGLLTLAERSIAMK